MKTKIIVVACNFHLSYISLSVHGTMLDDDLFLNLHFDLLALVYLHVRMTNLLFFPFLFFYLYANYRRSPISIAAAVIYIITQLSDDKKPLKGLNVLFSRS